MSTNIIIRDEEPEDEAAITDVTIAAFRDLEISNQTEHFIVKALRKADALTISLVAEMEGRIVGHIAFSQITMPDGAEGWYGLGPVSVIPERQRQGIGSALIEEGLSRLKTLGAQGCYLVGHPGYYTRFGFINTPDLGLEGVPAVAFHGIAFGDEMIPTGTVAFHEAFGAGQ